MKKISLISLFLILSLTVHAQTFAEIKSHYSKSVNVTQTVTTPSVTPSKTQFYTRLGLTFAKLSAESEGLQELQGFRNIGYSFSLGFNKNINKSLFYYGMELGAGTRGYTLGTSSSSSLYTFSMLAHNVFLSPIILGLKYNLSPKVAFDVHVAPYIAYDYNYMAELETDSDYNGYISLAFLDDLYNRFDSGVCYGFGLWFNDRFNIDLFMHHGLIAMYDDFGDGDTFTRNITIRLGVAF